MIVACIDQLRAPHSVSNILRVLREAGITIAESTYYAHQHRCYGLSARQLDDTYLANWLFDMWDRNFRVYGRRKLWKAAARAGTPLGREQVERLMKLAGISGLTCRRRTTTTTIANPAHARPGDHMRALYRAPLRPEDPSKLPPHVYEHGEECIRLLGGYCSPISLSRKTKLFSTHHELDPQLLQNSKHDIRQENISFTA